MERLDKIHSGKLYKPANFQNQLLVKHSFFNQRIDFSNLNFELEDRISFGLNNVSYIRALENLSVKGFSDKEAIQEEEYFRNKMLNSVNDSEMSDLVNTSQDFDLKELENIPRYSTEMKLALCKDMVENLISIYTKNKSLSKILTDNIIPYQNIAKASMVVIEQTVRFHKILENLRNKGVYDLPLLFDILFNYLGKSYDGIIELERAYNDGQDSLRARIDKLITSTRALKNSLKLTSFLPFRKAVTVLVTTINTIVKSTRIQSYDKLLTFSIIKTLHFHSNLEDSILQAIA